MSCIQPFLSTPKLCLDPILGPLDYSPLFSARSSLKAEHSGECCGGPLALGDQFRHLDITWVERPNRYFEEFTGHIRPPGGDA